VKWRKLCLKASKKGDGMNKGAEKRWLKSKAKVGGVKKWRKSAIRRNGKRKSWRASSSEGNGVSRKLASWRRDINGEMKWPAKRREENQ
jgi:hypothetical protein